MGSGGCDRVRLRLVEEGGGVDCRVQRVGWGLQPREDSVEGIRVVDDGGKREMTLPVWGDRDCLRVWLVGERDGGGVGVLEGIGVSPESLSDVSWGSSCGSRGVWYGGRWRLVSLSQFSPMERL
jgi:hypothetical protein